MKQETLSQLLERLDACGEARSWAKGKTRKRAWNTCERGDWMIWLLINNTMTQDERLLRLLACDIADTVLHLVPAGEDRPRLAIEAARGFANGTVSADEMAAAWAATGAARAVWAAWAATGAARAAAWAALAALDAGDAGAVWAAGAAARAAAGAVWAAAWAALDAGDAGAAGAAGAAWDAVNKRHADIVRKWFPVFPALRGEPK